MLVKTYSAAVNGLEVTTVTVEISLTRGIMFHLSGLADTAVKESHDRIVVALLNKKRTGVWLAQELGVSAVTVSKWCSNITQPILSTLSKIADLLEVDPRDLLNGKE